MGGEQCTLGFFCGCYVDPPVHASNNHKSQVTILQLQPQEAYTLSEEASCVLVVHPQFKFNLQAAAVPMSKLQLQ
jgi:hypothetical protein